ncbi:hypothetical protein GDO78_016298 [Eleutherodactylus coqui]|uniref:Uncharacterized protein n=1 Tax=Eleutherodactylus coqui TaxID=57060 RepID=A0A8J6B0E0_ELECQ|nr:hypothetical protein GDO78_016298 [Eleutherodactylus coqui]
MSSLYLKLNLPKTDLPVFPPSTNRPHPDISISVCGTITPSTPAALGSYPTLISPLPPTSNLWPDHVSCTSRTSQESALFSPRTR